MNWFRKNPLFASALVLLGLVTLAELGFMVERWLAADALAAKLVQRQQELAAVREVAPSPSRENAKAIEEDLARAQRALATMQSELKGRGAAVERLASAKVPPARPDAFFDLATFVEKTRELARKNEVGVRADAARFGFAAFANEGPDSEHIEAVFRQRLVAQYLLEALLESKPRALLAVRREVPLTRKEREDRDTAQAAALEAAAAGGTLPESQPAAVPDGPDYFAIDQAASVRYPMFVDTLAFRFVFTGQTAALRTFLNRLAAFDLPVIVREVEAEPATNEEATLVEETPAADAPAAEAPAKAAPAKPAVRSSNVAPIVARPLTKFTVTVEYIDLIAPAAANNAPPAPTS
jgi:hypothetical protein